MKKVAIGVGIFILFILLSAVLAFGLTSSITRVADNMFELVAAGRTEEAYNTYTSNIFKDVTSVEEFQYYTELLGLNQYADSTWNSRSINGQSGELTGTITTTSGTQIRLNVEFVQENGEWKIFAINVDQDLEDALDLASQTLPDDETLKRITQESMSAFADAVAAKDFSNFYEQIAPVWKFQTSVEELNEIFNIFFEKNTDLSFVKEIDPVFSEAPYFDENNTLTVKGNYLSGSITAEFILNYIYEEGDWALVGIEVNIL